MEVNLFRENRNWPRSVRFAIENAQDANMQMKWHAAEADWRVTCYGGWSPTDGFAPRISSITTVNSPRAGRGRGPTWRHQQPPCTSPFFTTGVHVTWFVTVTHLVSLVSIHWPRTVLIEWRFWHLLNATSNCQKCQSQSLTYISKNCFSFSFLGKIRIKQN